MTASSRCTGHCCVDFYIPADTVARLRADPTQFRDGEKIDAMLLPGSTPDHWKCKHFLEDGNCGNYENRPAMCADYPYGEPCKRPGCTLKEDRTQ